MNKAKIYIQAVDNGFIVNVKSHGLSSYQEPYEKSHKVFVSFEKMCEHLISVFGIAGDETTFPKDKV